MTSKHKEIAFEAEIEAHLLEHGGYLSGNPADFDRKRCLDPTVLIPFIQATQPKTWKTIADYHGANAETVLLDDLTRALAGQGMLQVLRHGFKCFGKLVRVAYFAPASRMNPETERLYRENRLTVTRQVHFSEKDEKSLDLVLAINGLPVVTAELKNHLTRQTVHDAMGQYRNDRDPREQLFRFKERALVHFAVDPDQVFMTTRLEGKATFFLPFNKGHNCGAGNPPNPGGHRTAYLWQEVWQRDSLLDIVGRFLHLETVEKKVLVTRNGESTVKKIKKETMIFPRYHQLDAVRRLIDAARSQGAGRQYLVQHSAGSGKSNTIGWLAHRLSSLHDANDGKVFDTVIVITDRRVLDKQLQDTIYQFEHKQGVVQKIDENTEQLVKALAGGTPIIITTLQKFPFILQTLERLRKQNSEVQIDTAGRRFAVIVDEAHSSQTGEQAAELKGILNDAELRRKARELAADEELEDSADEAMLLTMLKRGRQPNISFFAFTATPKHKTLKIFDEPGLDGRPPFHHYSMRQAIEENFIHDVLKHYVTYKTYFGLVQAAEKDPLVEKKKAAKALARFMSLHPTNIAQKTEVMVEHFRSVTRHKIGGRAKAMVVTDSRLHAVRYKQSFDAYIAKKGYTNIKTLVAFSGTVNDPDIPDTSYTEEGMNGIKERELPDKFESEEYQVLLVAEKYQTGFDQPLLHTMYVDKRLDGVQAVQTLSRLNRTCAGKEDTFVLDFRNEAENIYSAFKPYYEHTYAAEATSPQKLYELKSKLDGAFVYHQNEVDEFCKVYFSLTDGESARGHAQLNRWLDEAVERYKALEEEAQDDFKGWLVSFRNLYGFLSQIIPYQDSALEKLDTYGRFLFTKLPRDRSGAVDLGDEVQLKFYRLQKISEGQIALNVGEAEALYGPDEVGSRRSHDEQVPLSTLIQVLNERFGTDFKPADQLFFDQIEAEAVDREEIRQAARVNTIDDFRLVFERELDGLFIDRMEGNDDIFRRVMEDEKFRSVAAAYLIEKVYHQVRGETETPAL